MAPALVPDASDAVIVVTGGNRGLGIEHVKQFLEKTKVKIVATARQPAKADELNGLLKRYPDRLSIVELDTSSEESIQVTHAHCTDASTLHSAVRIYTFACIDHCLLFVYWAFPGCL